MFLEMGKVERLLLACGLIAVLGMAASRVESNDIFWQLQSGRYILETGSFIYRDTFSLAAEAPRWEHCWLHDVIFYGAYRFLGYSGISLLKGALVAATGAALVGVARRRGASLLSILLLTLPFFCLSAGGWTERPQLWTHLFFALFLLVLEEFRLRGGRAVWALVPLMLLWSNLHAGYILAFPLVGAYLVAGVIQGVTRGSAMPAGALRRLCWLFLLLGAAAAATPYGSMFLDYTLAATQGASGQLLELQKSNIDWRPPSYFLAPQFYWALGCAALLLLAGWRRLRLVDLLLLAGLVLMGLKMQRHTHFLLFGVAALIPVYADAAVGPLLGKAGRRGKAALRVAGIVTVALLLSTLGSTIYARKGMFDLGWSPWRQPAQAAAFVKENALPTNLFNTYRIGAYLTWTLFPDYKVFWDGRQSSTEMYRMGLRVERGDPSWEKILAAYGVNTIVTESCSLDRGERFHLLDRLKESPHWALVFAADGYLVFVRQAAVESGWLQEHRLPISRIDDTVLAMARILDEHQPLYYYNAYREMTLIHMQRKEYPQAYAAVTKYLQSMPPGRQDPEALAYYRVLQPLMSGR